MNSQVQLDLVSKTVATAFGQLHIRTHRTPRSSEAIILLHGFGSSWSVWLPVIEAATSLGLLTGRDILLVDLPGFGRSQNKLHHLNMTTVGAELIRVARSFGYTRLRVAGHSMGGFLALNMAATCPADLSSVHIVSGSYFTLTNMVNRPLATALHSPLIAAFYYAQLYLARHNGLARWLNAYLSRRATARHRRKPLYRLGGPEFRYGAANGKDYDAERIWGGIAIPVYGAFGARDRLVPPADMYHLQALLPAAKLTLIAGAGHSSLIDAPRQTARALFESLPPCT